MLKPHNNALGFSRTHATCRQGQPHSGRWEHTTMSFISLAPIRARETNERVHAASLFGICQQTKLCSDVFACAKITFSLRGLQFFPPTHWLLRLRFDASARPKWWSGHNQQQSERNVNITYISIVNVPVIVVLCFYSYFKWILIQIEGIWTDAVHILITWETRHYNFHGRRSIPGEMQLIWITMIIIEIFFR